MPTPRATDATTRPIRRRQIVVCLEKQPARFPMMRLTTSLAFTLALATAAQPIWAQNKATHNRYRWTDSRGVVQYSDSPTEEALQVGYDILDGRGVVIKHVDRVKTAAEKKADASAAVEAAQEKQRGVDAKRADEQLLQAYPSEAALIDAQKKRIAAIDQDIANVKVSQSDQEKSLTEQLAYAATFERDGKPVPAAVKQQIETLRVNVANQKKFIDGKLEKRANAEQKGQVELARYRELRTARDAEQP